MQRLAASLGGVALAASSGVASPDPSAEDSADNAGDHQKHPADLGIEIEHRISNQDVCRPEHADD